MAVSYTHLYQRVNKETVSLEPVEHKYDVAALKELIREHVEATGSPRGKEILDNFSEYLPKFKKVLPYDYDRMLRVIASMEAVSYTHLGTAAYTEPNACAGEGGIPWGRAT